ncbi:hypothetical protein FRAHR75_790016 [Frankia sp. Hr75.2]|nr:hypothetical protein FRAHR75_790016 [Frankia sp. Hr75.2]
MHAVFPDAVRRFVLDRRPALRHRRGHAGELARPDRGTFPSPGTPEQKCPDVSRNESITDRTLLEKLVSCSSARRAASAPAALSGRRGQRSPWRRARRTKTSL